MLCASIATVIVDRIARLQAVATMEMPSSHRREKLASHKRTQETARA